jgi:hypothetical protein
MQPETDVDRGTKMANAKHFGGLLPYHKLWLKKAR